MSIGIRLSFCAVVAKKVARVINNGNGTQITVTRQQQRQNHRDICKDPGYRYGNYAVLLLTEGDSGRRFDVSGGGHGLLISPARDVHGTTTVTIIGSPSVIRVCITLNAIVNNGESTTTAAPKFRFGMATDVIANNSENHC